MTLEEFINNLKRDRARGNLAPHQIILLLSLRKLILQNKSNTLQINDILDSFRILWNQNQNKYKTKNCNLGMPLKVFVNIGFLKLILTDEIYDFRNRKELLTKINQIVISSFLYQLLLNEQSEKYILSRIIK